MDSSLSVDRVLAPVDGTDESLDAVEYAVAIADRYDASLQALYVLDRELVRAIENGAIDTTAVAEDNRTFLQEVRRRAAKADVPIDTMIAYGFSTTRKTRHPGSVVLDSAEDVRADFIVIPREPPREQEAERGMLAKAAEYVLLYASQPVLSV